jgi:hypothetical protein
MVKMQTIKVLPSGLFPSDFPTKILYAALDFQRFLSYLQYSQDSNLYCLKLLLTTGIRDVTCCLK